MTEAKRALYAGHCEDIGDKSRLIYQTLALLNDKLEDTGQYNDITLDILPGLVTLTKELVGNFSAFADGIRTDFEF